jgi:hypothetical protein
MRLPNLPPHNAVPRSPRLRLRPVHEGDALAQVELGGLGAVDAFEGEEADVGVGVALAALVAEVAGFDVDCGGLLVVFVIVCMCGGDGDGDGDAGGWVSGLGGRRTAVGGLFGGHGDLCCMCE